MESYNSVVQEKQSELVLVDRHINIDSRDRNKTIFSNTNEYDINLREALFSVKKIELVSAEIPKSEYFVDGTNNLLEILIDPVLFANRSPSGSGERLITNSHIGRYQMVTIARVDESQLNKHGVVQLVNTTPELGADISSVFNASPTSHIDVLVLFESFTEVVCVISYSENDDNYAGNCRVMIAKYGTDILNASVSFGTEFGFGTPGQSRVFMKRKCALLDNKFAMIYHEEKQINLLVGSVGIQSNDTDGRLSNSNLVAYDANIYAICRIDESIAFVVYSTAQGVVAKLITLDADFALYLQNEIMIESNSVDFISCDSMNRRVIVSTVSNNVMKIHVLLVVEGPDVILLNSTTYAMSSALPSLNSSSSASFRVDPNAQVRWASDVFSVVSLYARRIDTNGTIMLNH
jgi:hypothetical protein